MHTSAPSVARVSEEEGFMPAWQVVVLVNKAIREMRDVRYVSAMWLKALQIVTSEPELKIFAECVDFVRLLAETLITLENMLVDKPTHWVFGLLNTVTDPVYLHYDLLKGTVVPLLDTIKRRRISSITPPLLDPAEDTLLDGSLNHTAEETLSDPPRDGDHFHTPRAEGSPETNSQIIEHFD